MHRRLQVLARRRVRITAGALSISLLVPAILAAQTTPSRRATTIQSVDAAPLPGGAGSALTIHANGPLPVPTVGVLDGPPRIYLDFPGVRLPSGVTAQWEDPLLRGVRLAQRTMEPLVARIVMDLLGPIAHHLDTSARLAGRIVVVLGEEPAAAPGSASPTGRTRDVEAYLSRVSTILSRLHALRPAIDAGGEGAAPADDVGDVAADELESLGRTLESMTVPGSVATTHDLLMRTCALGSRALRLRGEARATGDAAVARNAASAAAGALILLDRASRDLGYVPSR
jgi:hypothetical protein